MIRKEKSTSIRVFSGKKNVSKILRPNSAVSHKKYSSIKDKMSHYNQAPPPIIFTMPNNKKMTSGMGNNIEREQLYENNMQLKESLNKLKRELAETKYYVVKKDIDLREKEKIIRDFLKENDLESTYESKINKAKESALLTLCKEKYNNLKNKYQKEIQENKILKANIKITKIKEYQIENDILQKELLKIKSLYGNCKKNLKKYKGIIKDLNNFKEKFLEQHSIISSYAQKCDLLNAEIRNLKEERDNLLKQLELNMKKQEVLKLSNDKLKTKNIKFLNQKKIKEEMDFKISDNEKNLIKYKKDAEEFKKAFLQKVADYDNLKKTCDSYEQKINNFNNNILKPFQYKTIKQVEQENNPKNIDKIVLYKSLYDESKMKNVIYEKYFKERNINPKDVIREYGYTGVINTDNRLLLIKKGDKDQEKEKEKDKDKDKDKDNSKQSNEKEEKKEKMDNKDNIKKENNENIISDNINNLENKKNDSVNNNNNNIIIEEEKEDEKQEIKESEKKENQNEIVNANDDVKTKISEDNFSNTNTNTYTKANTNNINNINYNNNNIEGQKIDEVEENENEFLMIVHLFLKNFEANHITPDIIDKKMQEIFKSFEGKTESTKEDFLLPFYNLFIDSMKVTQEKDKQIVKNFLDSYLDYTNGNTNEFYNDLNEIFGNIVDYSSTENNKDLLDVLALNLQKYKNDLEKKLKEEDKDNTNIITFDSFRKIVNDLNLPLDDDLMEFLIYKMKSSVPENHSISDLNYKIILDLLNRKTDQNIEIQENHEIREKHENRENPENQENYSENFENPENLEEDEKNKDEEEDEKDNDKDDISKKISDKLSDFKNNMIKKDTDLEKVCMDKVQKFNDNEKNDDFEVIEKDDFFEIMENYGVTVNEEIKETIYTLFINENPICTNNGAKMMMDFKKLKNLFLNDYYSEENQ